MSDDRNTGNYNNDTENFTAQQNTNTVEQSYHAEQQHIDTGSSDSERYDGNLYQYQSQEFGSYNQQQTYNATPVGNYTDYNYGSGNNSGGKVKQKKRSNGNEVVINLILLVVILAFIATIVLRMFFFCQVRISQTSMYPTYKDGERVWVRQAHTAERGQVVVFFKNETHEGFWSSFTDSDTLIIKRVVAVGGDSIWVEEEESGEYSVRVKPYDSDRILKENYYFHNGAIVDIPTMKYNNLGLLGEHIGQQNALVIPEGYFFAMGDNRPVSDDSRGSYGLISFDRLLGIAV